MQIELKMISKMRLNDLSRALKLLKKESTRKVKIESMAVKKRKGKNIVSCTPKRKRHVLLLQDEEEKDEDETVSDIVANIAMRDPLGGIADFEEEEEDDSKKELEEESE